MIDGEPWDPSTLTKGHKIGVLRNTETGHYHVMVDLDDGEIALSEQSFESREELLDAVKQWVNELGLDYQRLQ